MTPFLLCLASSFEHDGGGTLATGSTQRSQKGLAEEVEKLGATLGAFTSREQTAYYASSLRQDVNKTVDILADLLQNPSLQTPAIEEQRAAVIKSEQGHKPIREVVFDHLFAVAFQKQALGRTTTGDEDVLPTLGQKELQAFHKQHYAADKTVLVGTGGVSHDELVQLAQRHFTQLPSSANPLSVNKGPATRFVGADVRIRDDAHPTANFAIAVEGAPYTSPDYIPLLVLQAVMGNYDRSVGGAALLSSRLSHTVHENELANSYSHFNTAFSDTGLWGVYVESENLGGLDDTVHFILKEWQRMSIAPTGVEVERAKAQLKAALVFGLDTHLGQAKDLGHQITATGKRASPEEVQAQIDAVTAKDIKRVASTYLWDRDIAISAFGSTEGIFPYDRIRADMSSMAY